MSRLTPKQMIFADEYIISGNATQVAIATGYSPKYVNTNASKLLQNTTLQYYLKGRNKELESQKIADMLKSEPILQVAGNSAALGRCIQNWTDPSAT